MKCHFCKREMTEDEQDTIGEMRREASRLLQASLKKNGEPSVSFEATMMAGLSHKLALWANRLEGKRIEF